LTSENDRKGCAGGVGFLERDSDQKPTYLLEYALT